MLAAEERVCLESRRHGIVLARPLGWAIALALGGGFALSRNWPFTLVGAGAGALVLAAVIALRAVWRWDRTHLVVTTDKLFVAYGILRRRAATVRLSSIEALELEQTLVGRLFGYGTLAAGTLEVTYVPAARQVCRLVDDLLR
jgi:membrane protein YdbS with pleckstrin-like domain